MTNPEPSGEGDSLPKSSGEGIGRMNREERRSRGIKGRVHQAAEALSEHGDVEVDEQGNR